MIFETLYQELLNSTEMIRALLAGISPQEARAKPNPDSWSILEVVCHLYDEEREDFQAMQEKFFAEQHISLDWLSELHSSDWDTTY